MSRGSSVLGGLALVWALLWPATFVHTAVYAAQSETARPRQPRIAVEDGPNADALEVLDRAGTLPFPVAVKVVADVPLTAQSAVDQRLSTLVHRSLRIWLAVPAPTRTEEMEPWREGLRQLLDRHGAALTALEVLVRDQDPALANFAVRLASTEARSYGDGIRLAIGGPRMADESIRSPVFTAELSPYVDLLSVPAAQAPAALRWLARVDPTASLVLTTEPNTEPDGATRDLADAVFQFAGAPVALLSLPALSQSADALRALSPVSMLLTDEISDLDDPGAALRLSIGPDEVTGRVRHRLLFDDDTFATYLAYWAPPQDQSLEVSIRLTLEGTPVVHDVVAGRERPIEGLSRDEATRTTRLRAPLTGDPMLVDFNHGAETVFGERSSVSGTPGLSVEEIIARHRVRQRRQERLVRNYVARMRLEQHFRPTIADPGYDVITENRYFVAGTEVEWEELSFSVNGSRWGSDRPPFPLLQPEKVLSLPLQLRFGEDYRYRLDGTDRVADYDCYVVRFEPLRRDGTFYRGTVWIDRQTFARVRVQAVQGGLPAPVVSNEEIQEYAPPVMVDGQAVHLLSGLTARQIMLIAGRNLLVEKGMTLEEVHVNDPEFETRRGEARAGDRIMFAETDRGLRYFVKEGEKRVVSERATQSARAAAMGVTLDPSYLFPLPIVGINYLDFDFGGPDSQLALLFGGVLAAGNIQRPKIAKSPFDASVDFFGIAVPSTDQLFDASGSRDAERVLTWPLTTGLNLGWQYTPFQKVLGQYQFRFDGFVRDRTTREDFAVPSSTVTNGFGATWEYRRGGFIVVLNGTRYRRSSWEPWGLADASGARSGGADQRIYSKYGATLSKDVYFRVFHKIHLNASWFSGRNLDRFAKYQFGLFDDTRIHGVPASGVRFADIAMARGSYSLNIFEQYRLDLFLEEAWGRDRFIDPRWRPITGLGVAVNFRAPKSTILRADFGRSFLPAPYSAVGSYNLQVLILKPLR